tara:strand:+ start:1671 stop:2117 length:447 start_codon:yes stop_codon:yes gene_type:complete
MSKREDIAKNIVDVLTDMTPPKPILVTREPLDVLKLAITQFPAVVVQMGNESREDDAMGGIRRGTVDVSVRGYVRADGREGSITTVDQKRNEMIERIEETLNTDRTRELTGAAAITKVSSIEVIERTPPLGEFNMIAQVSYTFTKGAL